MKPSGFALLLSSVIAGAALATNALAVDTITSRDAPDLTAVRAKIKARDFKGALAELTPMLTTYQHADVYNLMGFALRKTGDYQQAYTFYRKALDFDPNHKGALEYLGELYVETGQVDKAKENVVERWFGELSRECIRRGTFFSVADLEKAIGGGSAKVN